MNAKIIYEESKQLTPMAAMKATAPPVFSKVITLVDPLPMPKKAAAMRKYASRSERSG